MLGGSRHGGDEQERIVDRNLRGMRQGGVRVTAEDVVDAQDVGQEQTVEQPPFQRLRERDPGLEAAIVSRAVARVAPESRRLVRDAVHLEGV